MSTSSDGLTGEVATSLHRGTNWWGAFVIGLAGTILVTGIVPFAAQSMGAASVPAITLVVLIGLVLCFCMAELAAMLPSRTGGLPSYAYDSYKPLGETTARHVGGLSGWGYWLSWFPVAPINMILAAGYIAVLAHLPLGKNLLPLGSLGTSVTSTVLIITLAGLLLLFVPCYLGIRMGATFATVLGVLAMIPLTLLILLPVFKPSSFHWSNLAGFHYADPKTAGVTFFLAWIFVISWNAVLYGVFIYIGTAVVFVGVLGAALKTADPLTLYTSFADHIFGSEGWVKYLIGVPLVFALLLSVLNAIMGVGRSLFQAAEDRMLPRWFAHKNKHLVPDRAMLFNLICSMAVALLGSPVRIYIFSNVGYLLAIVVALVGYFMMRQFQPDRVGPFRMPAWFRWLALACGIFLGIDYFVGGWNAPEIVVGPGESHILYILGIVVLAAYLPLYFWRKLTDRRRSLRPVVALSSAGTEPTSAPPVAQFEPEG